MPRSESRTQHQVHDRQDKAEDEIFEAPGSRGGGRKKSCNRTRWTGHLHRDRQADVQAWSGSQN